MASETWFDINTGGVFMDVPGAPLRTHENDPNIISLESVISADELPFTVHDYDKWNPSSWSKEQFTEYGRWALELVRNADVEPIVTKAHLQRLYTLGVGPSYTQTMRSSYFNGIADFREEIGSERGYMRGQFDSWGTDDFTKAALAVEAAVGGLPLTSDYVQFASSCDEPFPTPEIIIDRIGSIRQLNDLIGYPDIQQWSREDYLTFGVTFIEVNGLDALKLDYWDVLSNRRRGPSDMRLHERFGSWQKYKELIISRYQQQQVELAAQNSRLVHYRSLAKNGKLPPEYNGFDDDKLRKRVSCFVVVSKLLPNLSLKQKHQIASLEGSDTFTTLICRLGKISDTGIVERTAKALQIDADIWQPAINTRYRMYLKVEPEAAEAVRLRKRAARIAKKRLSA